MTTTAARDGRHHLHDDRRPLLDGQRVLAEHRSSAPDGGVRGSTTTPAGSEG